MPEHNGAKCPLPATWTGLSLTHGSEPGRMLSELLDAGSSEGQTKCRLGGVGLVVEEASVPQRSAALEERIPASLIDAEEAPHGA